MFTRFRTESGEHVFDAPLIKIPPGVPGAPLLGVLGGAYQFEEEELRSRLVADATELKGTLEQPEFRSQPGIREFLERLSPLIEFLTAASDSTVSVFSWERGATVRELLDAYAEGSGAADWALEELQSRGEKGRNAMLAVLKKEQNADRCLSGLSLVLVVFRDPQTLAAVRKIVDGRDEGFQRRATAVIAAYGALEGVSGRT